MTIDDDELQKYIEAGYCDGYEDGYNKAIDDVLKKLNNIYNYAEKQTKYPQYDHYCNGVEDCIDIVEQLKEQMN